MTVPGDTSFKSATDPLEPARVATLNALFRRKAIEPGAEGTAPQNFIEHPDKDMALEDKVTKMHVDVFPADTSKMDVSMLTIDNQVVKALSPEALFIMRVQQLAQIMREQSDKEVIEVPQKILQYLFLNSSIVDDEKLKRVLAAQGIELDPVTYAHELNERLREGINSGTIALVDKYH